MKSVLRGLVCSLSLLSLALAACGGAETHSTESATYTISSDEDLSPAEKLALEKCRFKTACLAFIEALETGQLESAISAEDELSPVEKLALEKCGMKAACLALFEAVKEQQEATE